MGATDIETVRQAAAVEGVAPGGIVTSDRPPQSDRRRRGPVRAVVAELRPAEWTKNAFVLPPLVFSGHLEQLSAVLHTGLAFLAMCAVASAGYVVNDLRDVDLDRRHPRKRHRPIASGEISVPAGIVLAAVLALSAAGLGAAAGLAVLGLVGAYAALTVAYSAFLKTQVILDVLAIAGCFLIRVLAGTFAVNAPATEWMIVCTGMLAMFLGFAKRRQEAVLEMKSGVNCRPVLQHYSLPFLDQMIPLVTAGTIMSYVLYTLNSPLIGNRMLPTSVPVLYGVFRYLWLIYHCNDDRDTATLVRKDAGLIGAGAAWALTAVVLLYIV